MSKSWPQQVPQPHVYGNFRDPLAHTKKPPSRQHRREGNSSKHLEFIRSLPCCVCGYMRDVEAHHLKQGTGERGMGMKSTDKWAVPLCSGVVSHHAELERIGSRREGEWFAGYGIASPLVLALALWAATGNPEQAWKIMEAHNDTAGAHAGRRSTA